MTPPRARPIGVFDSGVGGLTVVRALRERVPYESVVYFGDTARLPYGPKSPDTVRRYCHEAAAFLLSRGVKLIVVACNTATAHAVDVLRRELAVPVIGVIEPAARVAVAKTQSGRIGVLGTTGTIASGSYDRILRRLLPESRIYAQSCPLLVPLVEEGLVDHPATRLIMEEYLRPFSEVDVDALILGCTHYPLLRSLISDLLGPGVALVDSAEELAEDVARTLQSRGLLRRRATRPSRTFIVSDSPLRFRDIGQAFVGDLIGAVEQLSLDDYDRVA